MKKIVIITNKCDNEEDLYSAYNIAYEFWNDKHIIFISALDGGNIHEIWSYIENETSEEIKNVYL